MVLLAGCGAAATVAIAQRLRELMPEEQTCSAGVAVRYDGETAESLLARAQRALQDAKTAGRGIGLSDPLAD
jgi:GGDEF domain-containing protein